MVAQSIGLLIGAALSIEVKLYGMWYALCIKKFLNNLQDKLNFFQTGVFIGPVLSVPTVLFSGFFVNFSALPTYLKPLPYVSYLRYSFEGAMITIYGYDRKNLECPEDFCMYKSPRKFLIDMSMDKAVYWIDSVVLFSILVGLRIAAYFVLRLKLHLLR